MNPIGLDQGASDSFVMPVKAEVEIFEDETLIVIRDRATTALQKWAGVLDNRVEFSAGSFSIELNMQEN